jgi:hypothetical protein
MILIAKMIMLGLVATNWALSSVEGKLLGGYFEYEEKYDCTTSPRKGFRLYEIDRCYVKLYKDGRYGMFRAKKDGYTESWDHEETIKSGFNCSALQSHTSYNSWGQDDSCPSYKSFDDESRLWSYSRWGNSGGSSCKDAGISGIDGIDVFLWVPDSTECVNLAFGFHYHSYKFVNQTTILRYDDHWCTGTPINVFQTCSKIGSDNIYFGKVGDVTLDKLESGLEVTEVPSNDADLNKCTSQFHACMEEMSTQHPDCDYYFCHEQESICEDLNDHVNVFEECTSVFSVCDRSPAKDHLCDQLSSWMVDAFDITNCRIDCGAPQTIQGTPIDNSASASAMEAVTLAIVVMWNGRQIFSD